MLITVSCKECGNSFKFQPSPSSLKRGCGTFCSRKCGGLWNSKHHAGENSYRWNGGEVERKCEICGTAFKTKRAEISYGNGKFCSRLCHYKSRKSLTGDKNPNWKGGVVVNIKCPTCGNMFTRTPAVLKCNRGKFCSRECSSIWTVTHSKTSGTSIEIKIEQELIRRGIVFQKQYPIWQAKTIPDFFIPPNICIYCDGDYWHNKPNTIKRDAQQDFMLKFLGYKVYRFWEHEINKDSCKCVNLIYAELRKNNQEAKIEQLIEASVTAMDAELKKLTPPQ